MLNTRTFCFSSSFLLISLFAEYGFAREATRIQPADSLPETTPWNLPALSGAPEFDWDDTLEQKQPVRSLHYQGLKYQGKPTRVFAYYATPGTLAGNPALDKDLPAVVLVHGGGGTAFEQWAKLWASRGYAAIAMDLAGHTMGRKRLPDGGPDQGDGSKFATDLPDHRPMVLPRCGECYSGTFPDP